MVESVNLVQVDTVIVSTVYTDVSGDNRKRTYSESLTS